MAEKSSPRFYLADLVAAVLACGVFAAMVASRRGLAESPSYLFLLGLVFIGWIVLRTLHGARICSKCGARFTPPKPIGQLMDCPHCGGRQVALARSLKRRTTALRAMTPLFAVFAAVTLIYALDVMRFGLPVEGTRLAVLLIPAGGAALDVLHHNLARHGPGSPGAATRADLRGMLRHCSGRTARRVDLPELPQ